MSPEKPPWDFWATTGNGLLVLAAIIMMAWAACSSGTPVYDEISHGPGEPLVVARP